MPIRIINPAYEKALNTIYAYDTDEYVVIKGASVANSIFNLSSSNKDIKSVIKFEDTTLYDQTVTVEAFKWKVTAVYSTALKNDGWLYGIISLSDGTHPSSAAAYISWKSYSNWRRYMANKGGSPNPSDSTQPEYIVNKYGNYSDFSAAKVSGDNPYGKYWLKLSVNLGGYGRFALRFWNKQATDVNNVEDSPQLPWDSMAIFFKTENAQPIIAWRGMPMRVLSPNTRYFIVGYFTDIILYNNSAVNTTASLYIGAIMLYPNQSY